MSHPLGNKKKLPQCEALVWSACNKIHRRCKNVALPDGYYCWAHQYLEADEHSVAPVDVAKARRPAHLLGSPHRPHHHHHGTNPSSPTTSATITATNKPRPVQSHPISQDDGKTDKDTNNSAKHADGDNNKDDNKYHDHEPPLPLATTRRHDDGATSLHIVTRNVDSLAAGPTAVIPHVHVTVNNVLPLAGGVPPTVTSATWSSTSSPSTPVSNNPSNPAHGRGEDKDKVKEDAEEVLTRELAALEVEQKQLATDAEQLHKQRLLQIEERSLKRRMDNLFLLETPPVASLPLPAPAPPAPPTKTISSDSGPLQRLLDEILEASRINHPIAEPFY